MNHRYKTILECLIELEYSEKFNSRVGEEVIEIR